MQVIKTANEQHKLLRGGSLMTGFIVAQAAYLCMDLGNVESLCEAIDVNPTCATQAVC